MLDSSTLTVRFSFADFAAASPIATASTSSIPTFFVIRGVISIPAAMQLITRGNVPYPEWPWAPAIFAFS
jgi:hypothetical protein